MVENWFLKKNPWDVGGWAPKVDISTSEVSQNTLERSSEAKADWWIGKMPLIPVDSR